MTRELAFRHCAEAARSVHLGPVRRILQAMMLTAATASAQPAEVGVERIRWSAPPGCPDAARVRAQVEERLGRGLHADGSASFRGEIIRTGDELSMRLLVDRDGATSERSLRGTRCESLTEAGALMIAMALDPEAVLATAAAREGEERADGPTQTAAPTQSAEPEERPAEIDSPIATESAETEPSARTEASDALSPSPPREDPAHPADARPTLAFVAAGFALLSTAALPSPAPGLQLALGARTGRVESWLGFSWLAPRRGALEEVDAGARIGLAHGLARLCVSTLARRSRRFDALPCTELQIGAMRGEGDGVDVTRSGRALWLAGSVSLQARGTLWRVLELRAQVGLDVPFVRAPFVLTIGGERRVVHRAPAASATVGLGLSVRLP